MVRKNIGAAGGVGLRMGVRGIGCRRFYDGGQRRGLGRAERCRADIKISLGGGLDAVCAAAEIHIIEVHLQDLVLGAGGFQLHRQVNLLQLAGDGLIGGEVGQLDQLLGDGAGALAEGAGPQIAEHRAQDAHRVEAVVLVKAQVFRRQKGVPRFLGQGGEGNHPAVLAALERADRLVMPIVDRAGLLHVGDLAQIQPLPGGHVKQKPARDQRGQRQPCQRGGGFPQEMPFGSALRAAQLPPVLPVVLLFQSLELSAHAIALPQGSMPREREKPTVTICKRHAFFT